MNCCVDKPLIQVEVMLFQYVFKEKHLIVLNYNISSGKTLIFLTLCKCYKLVVVQPG